MSKVSVVKKKKRVTQKTIAGNRGTEFLEQTCGV